MLLRGFGHRSGRDPRRSIFGTSKLRSSARDWRVGRGGRNLELGLRFVCCAKLGGEVVGGDQGSCERGGASSGFRMARFVEVLRSFSVGGGCDNLCPASQGLWRRVSAALLCSCAVVTPGMASPVAAVESVPVSDFLAALVTLGGALGILQFFNELAKRHLLEKVAAASLHSLLVSRPWPLALEFGEPGFGLLCAKHAEG